ncbi:hypothetical protein Scep_014458 [Stephania cephalantha]|uniref:Uncharacterized protein n=3 Tax=Stephania TaxID=147243 RepID=A0AAP0J3C7_9MAGN
MDKSWISLVDRNSQECMDGKLLKQIFENRKQKTICHRTGRKSFANVRYKRENKGLPTDRASVWLTAYYKRAGARSNEDTEEFAMRNWMRLQRVKMMNWKKASREEEIEEAWSENIEENMDLFYFTMLDLSHEETCQSLILFCYVRLLN